MEDSFVLICAVEPEDILQQHWLKDPLNKSFNVNHNLQCNHIWLDLTKPAIASSEHALLWKAEHPTYQILFRLSFFRVIQLMNNFFCLFLKSKGKKASSIMKISLNLPYVMRFWNSRLVLHAGNHRLLEMMYHGLHLLPTVVIVVNYAIGYGLRGTHTSRHISSGKEILGNSKSFDLLLTRGVLISE